jgi:hypothetical protein
MVVPLLTTTSRRRALSTWCCVSGKACRSSSRPCTGKAPRLHSGGCLSDKPPPRTTSLCLARLVSVSHDKSPPCTTSLHLARQVRLRLVRGPRRTARARPPTRVGRRISMLCGSDSWRPCRQPTLAGALMRA